jgi:hypothetical protein
VAENIVSTGNLSENKECLVQHMYGNLSEKKEFVCATHTQIPGHTAVTSWMIDNIVCGY